MLAAKTIILEYCCPGKLPRLAKMHERRRKLKLIADVFRFHLRPCCCASLYYYEAAGMIMANIMFSAPYRDVKVCIFEYPTVADVWEKRGHWSALPQQLIRVCR
jgi:hypothetical protein